MCGITGFVGKNAIKYTMMGLKNLEYRGYDSSGIAYIKNNDIVIKKEVGRITKLDKELDYNEEASIAIAHTRWATHGASNRVNAHPHRVGKITLVHNGIIENYEQIKASYNYKSVSDTDSEIIALLIDNLYKKYNDMLLVLSKIIPMLKGSYALNIINSDFPDTIYAIRKDSPLVVGVKKNNKIIASDIPAILDFTNKYYLLDNYDIVKASLNSLEFYDKNLNLIEKELYVYEQENNVISKNGYAHFMLKEINEEPYVFKRILDKYIRDNKIVYMFDISKYEEIEIVACGSAFMLDI